MHYEHAAIRTANPDVKVGEVYLYAENDLRVEVLVLEDLTDDDFITFRLRPLRANREPLGGMRDFGVTISREAPDYSGLWLLCDRWAFPPPAYG